MSDSDGSIDIDEGASIVAPSRLLKRRRWNLPSGPDDLVRVVDVAKQHIRSLLSHASSIGSYERVVRNLEAHLKQKHGVVLNL